MVSEVLTLSLNDSYWVVAEIASLTEHISGHCYLELVEKEEGAMGNRRSRTTFGGGGQFKAQARATIWRTAWSRINAQFFSTTGQYLAAGMKILLQAKVTFHEVYGYSLNVTDIDPTYTLGDMARGRQEILQQLADEGVIGLNKELSLPRPLQRVAVISAAGAAGYGDFCHQLDESGFRFYTKLFPAMMQGSNVESSVIAALDAIASEYEAWDCVVLIRGGGSIMDLNGFESYLLAANVAQFPLPVLTGIGHERDDTVVDFVAHTRLKTPTAVAQFLIDAMRGEVEMLNDLGERLQQGGAAVLNNTLQRFEQLVHRYGRAATLYASRQREQLLRLSSRLDNGVKLQVERQRLVLTAFSGRLIPAATRLFDARRHRLELIARTLQLAGPERILKMGYSITTDAEGRVVRSTADVQPGTVITTRVADGILTSRIEDKNTPTQQSV